MLSIVKDFFRPNIDDMLKWIEEEDIRNPTGRINPSTGYRRDIGVQHHVPKNKIFFPLYDYLNLYGEPTDVWVNLNPPGARNKQHYHIAADIAGCWYLQVPIGSGQLVFETGEHIEPAASDVYIWNGKKIHWVTTNISEKNRISISFNLRKR
jgi:hypothetical protein